MIIPTPQFDPMFADDGVPFRAKMNDFIRQEFSDLLGPTIDLPQNEQSLGSVARIESTRGDESPRDVKAA